MKTVVEVDDTDLTPQDSHHYRVDPTKFSQVQLKESVRGTEFSVKNISVADKTFTILWRAQKIELSGLESLSFVSVGHGEYDLV